MAVIAALRFSRGAGLPGAIVRMATWSWCSHVGFKLDDGRVLDATPEAGVSIRNAKDDASTRYFHIDSTWLGQIERERLLAFAMAQIGKPYDWLAIVGFGLRRDWHDDDAWFCSELVAGAFAYAGRPLLQADHLDRITPRDLLMSPLLEPAPPWALI